MHISNIVLMLTFITIASVHVKYQIPCIKARRKLKNALGFKEWMRQSINKFPMGLKQEAIFEASDAPEIRLLKTEYINAINDARPSGLIILKIAAVGIILKFILSLVLN